MDLLTRYTLLSLTHAHKIGRHATLVNHLGFVNY